MHQNGCSDESLAAILESLVVQGKLRNLAYSCNELRFKSIEQLSKLFYPSKCLKSLILNKIDLSEELVVQLFASLKLNEQLIKLVLKDVNLSSDPAGTALASCVNELY